jgi:hypothetical protein
MAMIKTCAQNTIVLSPDQTCTTPGSNARIFSRGLIEPFRTPESFQTLESHDHNIMIMRMIMNMINGNDNDNDD